MIRLRPHTAAASISREQTPVDPTGAQVPTARPAFVVRLEAVRERPCRREDECGVDTTARSAAVQPARSRMSSQRPTASERSAEGRGRVPITQTRR